MGDWVDGYGHRDIYFSSGTSLESIERVIKLTIKWFKAATIRAVKTAAQTAIATIGTTAVIYEVDWQVVGGTVLLATVSSYLTSLAGLPEAPKGEGE